jgi:iron-sulfur cluster assembly protein
MATMSDFAPIRLSEPAARRVRQFLAEQPGKRGLRFGVKRTGCSGWAYVIDLADAAGADDTVFRQDGIDILVNAESLPLVAGTEIDFREQPLGSSFVFRNPNVTAECGCGESFTTRPEHA